MTALALPDLTELAGERDAVLGGITSLAKALPDDPAAVAKSLADASGSIKTAVPGAPTDLTGTLTASISTLAGKLPADGMPAVTEIEAGLKELLSLVGPARDTLTKDGALRDIKSLVLELAGDPAAHVTELLTHLTGAFPAETVEVLTTFVKTLTAFEANVPADPAAIGEFLARGFLGLPSDLLAAPAAAVDGFLHGLGSLVDAGQVAHVGTELTGIAADLAAIDAKLTALDPDDAAAYVTVRTALAGVKTRLLALRDAVQTLAGAYHDAVGALDLSELTGPLATALAAVPEVHVAGPDEFVELVMIPIREVSASIDALSPADVAAALQGLEKTAQGIVGDIGGPQALESMVEPLTEVGAKISSLKLERVRAGFDELLSGVTPTLTQITGEIGSIRTALVAALDATATPLAAVTGAGAEVEQALKTIGDALQAATGGASLTGLHDKGVEVIGQLKVSLGGAADSISEAMKDLEGLVGQLDGIDLGAAAQQAVAQIGKLTETLSSLDLSAIPDAVLQETKQALSAALGQIDLTPVRGALGSAVEAGPGKLLLEFADKLEALEQKLAEFSPAGLLQPVIEPFNKVVAGLADLDPQRLLDPVVADLQAVRSRLDDLSPAKLVAPLDQPLTELRSALEELAPTKLLAPLHEPFAALEELVAKLDVTPFIDELDGLFADWLGQALGGLGKLGDAFSGAGEMKAFVDGLGTAGPADAEFGFRPGDILRPVQRLYEKLVSLIEGLPTTVLVPAFESLRVLVVDALETIEPAGLGNVLTDRLHAVRAGFDFDADFGLVEDLFARYSALRISFDALDEVRVPAAAQADFTASATLVAEIDPEAVLGPVRAALATARGSATGVAAKLDVSSLTPAFTPVATRVDALVPDFLRQPLTTDSIKAGLDALNPGKLADQVNAEFDAFLAKTAKFSAVFEAELPKVAAALVPSTATMLPAALKEAFQAVYGPLRTQLEALDPAPFAADLEATVYAPVKASLDGLSLKSIVEDSALQTQFTKLTSTFDGVVSDLVALRSTIATAWQNVTGGVLAVSPVSIQAELQEVYAPVAKVLESIDLKPLVQKVDDAFGRLEDKVDDVIAEVVQALEAMVAAIPSGLGGVNAQIDFGAGAAAAA